MRRITPGQGMYCFTLDDNIRFLEESTCFGYKSIFQHPYMALFQRLHQTYGAKFQFNMYYSYEPGGFSLMDVPSIWREELEANAHWMRFSFHARHNDPPFPYAYSTPDEVLRDYTNVMSQMRRIAGKAATDGSTTIHYACLSREECVELRKLGVRGLIGMFFSESGSGGLRYYLTAEQARQLQQHPLWYDDETDICFACNDAVLNTLLLENILPTLAHRRKNFYHVMIHEQYFYPDYCDWQPDFAQKVELALKWFQEMNLKSCFLEEII